METIVKEMVGWDIDVIILRNKRDEVVGLNYHYGAGDREVNKMYEKPDGRLWMIYNMLITQEQENLVFREYHKILKKDVKTLAKVYETDKWQMDRIFKAVEILSQFTMYGDLLDKEINEYLNIKKDGN